MRPEPPATSADFGFLDPPQSVAKTAEFLRTLQKPLDGVQGASPSGVALVGLKSLAFSKMVIEPRAELTLTTFQLISSREFEGFHSWFLDWDQRKNELELLFLKHRSPVAGERTVNSPDRRSDLVARTTRAHAPTAPQPKPMDASEVRVAERPSPPKTPAVSTESAAYPQPKQDYFTKGIKRTPLSSESPESLVSTERSGLARRLDWASSLNVGSFLLGHQFARAEAPVTSGFVPSAGLGATPMSLAHPALPQEVIVERTLWRERVIYLDRAQPHVELGRFEPELTTQFATQEDQLKAMQLESLPELLPRPSASIRKKKSRDEDRARKAESVDSITPETAHIPPDFPESVSPQPIQRRDSFSPWVLAPALLLTVPWVRERLGLDRSGPSPDDAATDPALRSFARLGASFANRPIESDARDSGASLVPLRTDAVSFPPAMNWHRQADSSASNQYTTGAPRPSGVSFSMEHLRIGSAPFRFVGSSESDLTPFPSAMNWQRQADPSASNQYATGAPRQSSAGLSMVPRNEMPGLFRFHGSAALGVSGVATRPFATSLHDHLNPLVPEVNGELSRVAVGQKSQIVPRAELGLITLMSPPVRISSEQNEAAGSALEVDWAEIAGGMGELDAGGFERLKEILPQGAQLLYPAVSVPGKSSHAVNLRLAPELVDQLLGQGFENTYAPGSAQIRSMAQKDVPGAVAARSMQAKIVPHKRPTDQGGSVLGGTSTEALKGAGQAQARRSRELDFMGLPIRLAPSLSGNSELADELAVRTGQVNSPGGAALRPHKFAPVQRALFPLFQSVDAEPDTVGWEKARSEFGLASGISRSILSPDAKQAPLRPSDPMPAPTSIGRDGADVMRQAMGSAGSPMNAVFGRLGWVAPSNHDAPAPSRVIPATMLSQAFSGDRTDAPRAVAGPSLSSLWTVPTREQSIPRSVSDTSRRLSNTDPSFDKEPNMRLNLNRGWTSGAEDREGLSDKVLFAHKTKNPSSSFAPPILGSSLLPSRRLNSAELAPQKPDSSTPSVRSHSFDRPEVFKQPEAQQSAPKTAFLTPPATPEMLYPRRKSALPQATVMASKHAQPATAGSTPERHSIDSGRGPKSKKEVDSAQHASEVAMMANEVYTLIKRRLRAEKDRMGAW